jgi:hypothetical protein
VSQAAELAHARRRRTDDLPQQQLEREDPSAHSFRLHHFHSTVSTALSLPLSAAIYQAAICGVTSPANPPPLRSSTRRSHPDPESHRCSHASTLAGVIPLPGTTPSHLSISSLAQYHRYVILFHWPRGNLAVNFSALRDFLSATDRRGRYAS